MGVDRTTIVPLPYDSIEIVFGPTQLWGNLGNHHPSCIFYDFEEDKRSWRELLGREEISAVLRERGVTIPMAASVTSVWVWVGIQFEIPRRGSSRPWRSSSGRRTPA